MKPLLNIRTVPAEIEIRTVRAKYEILKTPRARLDIKRIRNGLSIKTNPVKVTISNRALREEILSMKPHASLIREFARQGLEAAREATAAIAEYGNMMADTHIGTNQMAEIAYRRLMASFDTVLAFIPSSKPEINVEGGTVEISYTPDKLVFDWNIEPMKADYQPYRVEIKVKKYPKVAIEYTGKPVYTPLSAGLTRGQKPKYNITTDNKAQPGKNINRKA